MKKIYFILLIIIISFTSCSLFQSEVDTVIDLLPRDSDVPGWVRIDSVQYYKDKNVKKYNRDYRGLGIERLAACTYKSIDNGDVTIRLEVIKFSSVLTAYGFYSVKRGLDLFEPADLNEFFTDDMALIQVGEYGILATTANAEQFLKKI